MWTLTEHPPQPFGECTICKRHTCGEYKDEEGMPKQAWLNFPLEMDRGGSLHIGYQCIKGMSEDIGLTKTIVEKLVLLTPTPEQIHQYIMSGIAAKTPVKTDMPNFTVMSRDELKSWLKERNIEFTPQWGEDKLRELAMQHV